MGHAEDDQQPDVGYTTKLGYIYTSIWDTQTMNLPKLSSADAQVHCIQPPVQV